MSSPSELSALSSIIASSVKDIEAAYAKQDIPYPSLNDAFAPSPLDKDPSVVQTKCNLVAAAAQIIASVRHPMENVLNMAMAFHLSSTAAVAVENHFANIIKEAGPQGLHAKEIAAIAGIDPSKTARILRFLATHHVFREVAPNVFANNRTASTLIRPKTVAELKADPDTSFDGAPIAAIVSHITDEVLTSAPYLTQYIRENKPDVASPFNLSHNTNKTVWEWYEEPGNEARQRKFATGMRAGSDQLNPKDLLNDDYWGNLTENDVVVDIGGSVGSVTLRLAKAYPKPRFIVQDLQKVIEGTGKAFWEKEYPEALQSGRVQLQVHSFFEPNPVKDASVYFLRFVLHDWSDEECTRILSHVRSAANSKSRLIIFEGIMPLACPDPGPFSGNQGEAPYPLLANLGAGKGLFHNMVDLSMMTGLSGQERTVGEFAQVGKASGWKLETVNLTSDIPARMSGLVFSAA